jgi:hypothetical protein
MAQKVFSPGSGREQGGVRRGPVGEGVRSQNPGARRTGGQVGVRGGWQTRLIRVLEGSRLLDFAAL